MQEKQNQELSPAWCESGCKAEVSVAALQEQGWDGTYPVVESAAKAF